MILAQNHPLADGRTGQAALIRAYRGDRPETTPIWFMRQAGRSLPEYREIRLGTDMLDACLTPELASEITLQPVRRHGVDAAVFFSDIVVPLKLAGVGVDIVPGRGPVMEHAVRTRAEVDALVSHDPAELDGALEPVREAVARTVAELGNTPLIGFAGAPFTLAAYLVEGGPSKDHLRARAMMHGDPGAWQALLSWTAEISGRFLRAQIEAGASATQLFDSWAGGLGKADYEQHVAPFSRATLDHLRGYRIPGAAEGQATVPLVHFGVGTAELLPAMHAVGVDAVGVDWRLPLDEAERRLGGGVPLQGNIDPALLFAPWEVLEAHVRAVHRAGLAAPAHVLNLGHGVPPDADPTVLTRVVELAHSL